MWLLVAYAKNVMVNVSSAIHTFDHVLWLEYAMNVITARIKEDASFVVGQEYQTPITAKNVLFKRKIVMVVLKLSTWVARKLIYSMNVKNTASRKGSIDC